jgi:hypothetical protein
MPDGLEQVLAPGYLDDLSARSLAELRSMRAECQEVETGLSLLRRVVQGHLDIVGLEVERRAGGAGASDRGELLARLPELLADRTASGGTGRLSNLMAPESIDPGLEAELAELVGSGPVDPSDRDDGELRTVAERLAAFEGRLSQHRRDLFDRIDALQEEIARRYRSGDASVDQLLA